MADGSDLATKEKQKADGEELHHVYALPDAGRFIIPKENTWPAHAKLIRDKNNALYFNTTNYPSFDKVIAEKLKERAVYDPMDANYGRYIGLRNNIAGLRNFILGHLQTCGAFANGDAAQLPHLGNIAASLAEAMSKNSTRQFSRSISMDVATIEGAGAMAMYKYLLDIQEAPGALHHTIQNFKSMLNIPDRAWGLPPLEETPFSPDNLAAPADPEFRQRDNIDPSEGKITDAALADPLTQSIEITESIVATATMLRSVDALEEIPREESIEEARKILRALRNMEFVDQDLEEFLDHGTPQTVVAKKQSLQKLVHIFTLHLRQAQTRNEKIQDDPAVQNARNTVNTIALELAEHTRRLLADKDKREIKLDALIDSLPPESMLRQNQSLEQLLETLELGLERVSGKTIEISTLDRLVTMRDRLEFTANTLHSPDSMKEPVREESIELAREIFRRLQNLSFSDRSLGEFIQNGHPEDKAAFAQQISEAVDIYKNLLSEAAQTNPGIYQDEEVKKAADAVSTFMHSVKLMAAKEMPSSIASAQHISSEAARDPEQWGDMHQHTVNRLLKSAEGALEKAIGEMAQEQEEQEQNEQQAQDAIDQALLHSDQAKRKKKRRKGDSKPRSGKSGKKQRKQNQDQTSDDYVLKQGRFNEHAKAARTDSPAPQFTGLKEADLAAIKELGGSLRDISNQLKDIAPTIATVTAGDKIAPDDKTLSQRLQEREQQQTQNPAIKGNQGPRV